tara:strand:- start:31 stop:654 length:624 start_codon:yes stop_codon:yes gene_type:complete
MDSTNTSLQHAIVGILTIILVLLFTQLLKITWSTAVGRVSFILLFLVLFIGPTMKIKQPTNISSPLMTPWSWRGELGIWFTLTGLIHFLIIIFQRPFSELIKIGGSGFSLANLLGLVALLLALILTFTSFNKTIRFIGVTSWKWIHSYTYVIFYLISTHFIYFQFFSTYGKIGPDWFGYLALSMSTTIIILQIIGFILTLKHKSKEI